MTTTSKSGFKRPIKRYADISAMIGAVRYTRAFCAELSSYGDLDALYAIEEIGREDSEPMSCFERALAIEILAQKAQEFNWAGIETYSEIFENN